MADVSAANWQANYKLALDKLNATRKKYSGDRSPQAVAALTNAQNEFSRTVSTLVDQRIKQITSSQGVDERHALLQLAGTLVMDRENVTGENQALARTILARAAAPAGQDDPLLQNAANLAQSYLSKVTGTPDPSGPGPQTPNPTMFAPGSEPEPGSVQTFHKNPDTGPKRPATATGDSKSLHIQVNNDEANTDHAMVEGVPAWEPTTMDMNPGSLPTSLTSTSGAVAAAAQQNAVRPLYAANSQNYMPPGLYNRSAMNNNQMVFTGYKTSRSSRMDDDNPFGSRDYVNTKTPTYQSVDALKNALGRTDLGYPDVRTFQKLMGLPETGVVTPDTLNVWQEVLQTSANTTSTSHNTTWMQVVNAYAAQVAAAKAKAAAAQAAMYRVDETTSASIVGGASKQMLGRLSTGDEDKAFHSAFSKAYTSSQGRVDAQQFARDWIREHHPEEAGTQLGQDYYGAMYDVLTAGPGSLGAEAASVNG